MNPMSDQNGRCGLDCYLSTSGESEDEHEPLENEDDEIDEQEEARYGRQRLLEKPYGNWEESYDVCQSLLLTIKSRNPKSVVEWKTHFGVTANQVIFQRVFWAFGPCIEGFRRCFPVIVVDSISLTGKYKGALLTANSMEGSGIIVPIAFAVVERESKRSWCWFVKCLHKHVTDIHDICIISNHNAGLHRAIKDIGRGWTWRWCLQHYVNSYKESIANFPQAIGFMPSTLWRTGAINQSTKFATAVDKFFKFDAIYKRMRSTDWVEHNQLYWSLARDNETGGQRNGILATTIADNPILKGVSNMPIATLVSSTFLRTKDFFEYRRYTVGEEWNRINKGYNGYSGYCNAVMRKRTRKARDQIVKSCDGSKEVFEVKSPPFNRRTPGEGVYTVKLDHQNHTGMCTCGKFQATRMPCSHAIAACLSSSIKRYTFVSDLYALVNIHECYRESFVPIGGYRDWLQHSGPTLIPYAASLRLDESSQHSTGS